VYDVTSFLPEHPGGAAVVIKNSGRDATKAFAPIHPPGTLSMLDPKAHIGPVDPATIPAGKERVTEEELRIQKARAELPAPEGALNLHDIEVRPHCSPSR
jgi:L-lactate dehydrogenase (cytochrome)